MFPDRDTFLRLSGKGKVVPVYREILADLETPVSAYLKVMETPSFLLESVEGGEKWGRYSFIGTSVGKVIRARGNRVELLESGELKESREYEDPIDALKEQISLYRPVHVEGLPGFFGGLVGYVGYEMVRYFERVPDRDKPAPGLYDMFFMIPDVLLIFDNLRHTLKIVAPIAVGDDDPDRAYTEAQERIDRSIGLLRGVQGKRKDPPSGGDDEHEFISSFGPAEAFEDAVRKAKEYVRAGDVIQVVLSQRFERGLSVSPFDIYRALRVINPSPYMYYIDTGEARLIGSSPEILVKLEGKDVVLRPIAGTRGRGATEEEDRALERELKEDPKEVAEHIMLVDLGRNDVGRVSEMGSVRVTELMTVERYSHVMHLVSNVTGTLREGLDAFDVFRACFPAGTVTGAPKVRAMEIIDELEPVKRGPYAGAVGYFGYSGNMDTCITIRTIIAGDNRLYLQAGAGIVADSVPELEYKETVNKARGMIKAVDMAERGL
ncbi:anthranilate synthase component 1 [bacterium BMS3Bbin06]|nr:anthranilate synthase component 1 [bacterium BMS3Abin08]GBE33656.1 anthranilate synthase component 1 [bacterium BMS3Bbin06]